MIFKVIIAFINIFYHMIYKILQRIISSIFQKGIKCKLLFSAICYWGILNECLIRAFIIIMFVTCIILLFKYKGKGCFIGISCKQSLIYLYL